MDRKWQAVWIENEFLRVLVLPEIGGRIHAIQDKTNGYDLIYNQPVIKPALVGLAGPVDFAAASSSTGRSIIGPRRSCRWTFEIEDTCRRLGDRSGAATTIRWRA